LLSEGKKVVTGKNSSYWVYLPKNHIKI